jgi:hypothetical protein
MRFHNTLEKVVKLTLWRVVTPGLSTTETLNVGAGQIIDVPASSVDEFIVEAEDYTRIGKFRAERATDGRLAWTVYEDIDIVWSEGVRADPPEQGIASRVYTLKKI